MNSLKLTSPNLSMKVYHCNNVILLPYNKIFTDSEEIIMKIYIMESKKIMKQIKKKNALLSVVRKS